jgi:hypothetical protein
MNIGRTVMVGLVVASVPLLGGGKGCGGAVNSETPAPSVNGLWSVAYDDMVDVEITIGGSVYNEQVSAAGGMVTVTHAGTAISFDVDCSRPEVVCPSEAWPTEVGAEMRNDRFPHRMWVTLPRQECSGTTAPADPTMCGEGTGNPDCEDVCNGEIVTREREVFGVIDEEGNSFDLFLGAGVATNGINCGMLGISTAHAQLINSGTAGEMDWRVEQMSPGEVVVGYAGGCLWVGDPDMDGTLEALVIGATLKFTTGFTATRVER